MNGVILTVIVSHIVLNMMEIFVWIMIVMRVMVIVIHLKSVEMERYVELIIVVLAEKINLWILQIVVIVLPDIMIVKVFVEEVQ